MARTVASVFVELLDLAPGFFKPDDGIERDFLDALASVLQWTEIKIDALLLEAFRQTASGEYLDALGREFGAGDRWLGETDDQYRERVVIGSKGVTPNFIRAIIQRVPLLDGYYIEAIEPRDTVLDADFYLGTIGSILTSKTDPEPRQLIWLAVPLFEVKLLQPNDRTYVDDDSPGVGVGAFLDVDTHLDAQQGDTDRRVFKRLWQVMDTYRAAGVWFGATIYDEAQTAYFNLFEDLDL